MPKKCEFKKDWKAQAEYCEDELYESLNREKHLNERLAEQTEKINKLQETIFVLTSLIKDLKGKA